MGDTDNKDELYEIARNLSNPSDNVEWPPFLDTDPPNLGCYNTPLPNDYNVEHSTIFNETIDNSTSNEEKRIVNLHSQDKNLSSIDQLSSLHTSINSDITKTTLSINSLDLCFSNGSTEFFWDEQNYRFNKTNKKLKKISHESTPKFFVPEFQVASVEDSHTHVIDPDASSTWEFPTNLEKRVYQYNIIENALFKNTLVCLPTGMGKTFIAAVVMYNYYRWFPYSKIVFMAPTKPLVMQQYNAFRSIVDVSSDHMINLTGTTTAQNRAKLWKSKRIFFVTPQIPKNDINSGLCPTKNICLLVIDEAHKATGNYPYCDVVKSISGQSRNFRILALSATPGNDRASIQRIVKSLLISHLEVKTESNPEILPYIHKRDVESIVLKLSPEIICIRQLFMNIANVPLKWLQENQFLYRNKSNSFISFTSLDCALKNLQKRIDVSFPTRVLAESNFSICKTFYHGYKLLNDYGLYAFNDWLEKQVKRIKEENISDSYNKIIQSKEWNFLLNQINLMKPLPEHPKLVKLKSLISSHFESQPDSKIIVFAHLRIAVEEILRALSKNPMIKPISFIGQSKNGLSQKKQSEIIEDFHKNLYNTFISTCVGEEGLDIDEVNLVICFDSNLSSTRTLQRMGRTGRKKDGKCIMLFTAGLDDKVYQNFEVKKEKVNNLLDSPKYEFLEYEPQLLPQDLRPKVVFKSLRSCSLIGDNSGQDSFSEPLEKDVTSFKKPKLATSKKKANDLTLNAKKNVEDDLISLFLDGERKLSTPKNLSSSQNDTIPGDSNTNSSITNKLKNDTFHIVTELNQPFASKQSSMFELISDSILSSDTTSSFDEERYLLTSTPPRKIPRMSLFTANPCCEQIISNAEKTVFNTRSTDKVEPNLKLSESSDIKQIYSQNFTDSDLCSASISNTYCTEEELNSKFDFNTRTLAPTKSSNYSNFTVVSQSNEEKILNNHNSNLNNNPSYKIFDQSSSSSPLNKFNNYNHTISNQLKFQPNRSILNADTTLFTRSNPEALNLSEKKSCKFMDVWSIRSTEHFNKSNQSYVQKKISDSNSCDIESVFVSFR